MPDFEEISGQCPPGRPCPNPGFVIDDYRPVIIQRPGQCSPGGGGCPTVYIDGQPVQPYRPARPSCQPGQPNCPTVYIDGQPGQPYRPQQVVRPGQVCRPGGECPTVIIEDPNIRPVSDTRNPVRPSVRPEVRPDVQQPAQNNPQAERQALEQFRRTTQTYPAWNQQQSEANIARAFNAAPTTQAAYETALFAAAAEKKPVVMMVGRSSEGSTRQVVDQSARQMRALGGNQAAFIFVDLDKVDPNSTIGRFAASIEQAKGAPYTMVFTQRPGDNGSPTQVERPTFGNSGPMRTDRIQQAIQAGRTAMEGRNFPNLPRPQEAPPVRPQPGTDQLPPPPSPERERPPAANMEQVQRAAGLLDQAVSRQAEKRASYDLFRQSMQAADASGDSRLAAITRVELGLACLNWGHTDQGVAWLLDAGKKDPALYSNENFARRLQQANIPQETITLLQTEGRANPQWYMANRTEALNRIKATLQPRR